jgi:nitroimidazol reductase NimA-like FMN-containing flavoprotein (pyridoxamine 5'-phosphate oxidase superfamily)
MDVTGDWNHEQTEAFLTDRTIPVRLACRRPDDRLWMLSLWYRYRDGRLACATNADARIVSYLEADPGIAFEISTNKPPYRGVRGAGTARIGPDDDKQLLRALLERYLGGTDSNMAAGLLSPDREEVRIILDVDRTYTWDFSDRMPESTDDD